MTVRFLLICEGSSDAAFVLHIQRVLIHCGATEADGTASYRGRSISGKIRLGMQQYGDADLLFVHRDADSAGADARYTEIHRGVSGAGYRGDWVGIVPVRMMEASAPKKIRRRVRRVPQTARGESAARRAPGPGARLGAISQRRCRGGENLAGRLRQRLQPSGCPSLVWRSRQKARMMGHGREKRRLAPAGAARSRQCASTAGGGVLRMGVLHLPAGEREGAEGGVAEAGRRGLGPLDRRPAQHSEGTRGSTRRTPRIGGQAGPLLHSVPLSQRLGRGQSRRLLHR